MGYKDINKYQAISKHSAKLIWVDDEQVVYFKEAGEYKEVLDKKDFKTHAEFFTERIPSIKYIGDLKRALSAGENDMPITIVSDGKRYKAHSFLVIDGIFFINVRKDEEEPYEIEIEDVGTLVDCIKDESEDKIWNGTFLTDVEVKIFIGDYFENGNSGVCIEKVLTNDAEDELLIVSV